MGVKQIVIPYKAHKYTTRVRNIGMNLHGVQHAQVVQHVHTHTRKLE